MSNKKKMSSAHLADRYSYRVTWSEDDGEHVGLCVEFPSLSWLAASQEAALKGIRNVVIDVLEDMRKNEEKAPEPLASRSYSGKFKLRIPPFLHRQLTIEAKENHVSLNRLIAAKLAAN